MKLKYREAIAEKAKVAYSKENMAKEYIDEYDRKGYKNRILLIDVNCKGSSTGKIVYDLYRSIRDDGRKAAICYGRGKLIEEEGIYKFGLDWETYIHAGLARITGYNGCFSPFSTRRLIQKIEEFQPDVIHIHELHAYFVNIKPLIEYIKKKSIPVVWTFHCEYMYTGKCGHAFECTNFQRDCGNCPDIKEYPKSLFFDKTREMLEIKKELLQDLDFTIVTPSQWLADRVKMTFLKNKRIRIIHNGIDTDIFHPVDGNGLRYELRIPEDYKIVLAVAPNIMSEAKGGQWVLELAKRMKCEKVYFILVGGGEIPKDLPANVLFVGEIGDQYLLNQYYSLADVFVLLSQRETYSMTCAEALCCGTPVVGFKCGAPETIFKTPMAKFVEFGDIEGLIVELNNYFNFKYDND